MRVLRGLGAILAVLAIAIPCFAAAGAVTDSADQIATDTSLFNNNLGPTDTDVQKALDTLDNLTSYKLVSAPATPNSAGVINSLSYDANYFYFAVNANTWKRIAWDTTWTIVYKDILTPAGNNILTPAGNTLQGR